MGFSGKPKAQFQFRPAPGRNNGFFPCPKSQVGLEPGCGFRKFPMFFAASQQEMSNGLENDQEKQRKNILNPWFPSRESPSPVHSTLQHPPDSVSRVPEPSPSSRRPDASGVRFGGLVGVPNSWTLLENIRCGGFCFFRNLKNGWCPLVSLPNHPTRGATQKRNHAPRGLKFPFCYRFGSMRPWARRGAQSTSTNTQTSLTIGTRSPAPPPPPKKNMCLFVIRSYKSANRGSVTRYSTFGQRPTKNKLISSYSLSGFFFYSKHTL